MSDLHFEPASAIAHGVAQGRWSAREVVEHHIRRIESTHAAFNAVVWPRFEQARAETGGAEGIVAQPGLMALQRECASAPDYPARPPTP